MTSYKWKRIEDLPDGWKQIESAELRSLEAAWLERAKEISESAGQKEFNARLSREWAIETGVIEKVFALDRGTTEILIEQGIEASLIQHDASDKPAELVVSIVRDHQEALDGLFDFVARRQDLSKSYIRSLHQVLTRHQPAVDGITQTGQRISVPLLRGEWKKMPNNPSRDDGTVHEYCPPVQVESEMEQLVTLHNKHSTEQVPPEIEAAWLHHRFTQIHPFMDGNGRVARALASLVFLRAGLFPLTVHRDTASYVPALEAADRGNLDKLVQLFARIQISSVNRALSISEDVISGAEPIDRMIIVAAADQIRTKRNTRLHEQESVFQLSHCLEDIAYDRLSEVSRSVSDQLRDIDPSYSATVDRSDADRDFWYRMQIEAVSKELGYYADTRSYRAWVSLKIWEERNTRLVLSFHSLGVKFLGIMAVSAFLEFRDLDEDTPAVERPYAEAPTLFQAAAPRPVAPTVFQFSYKESEESVRKRFVAWLNDAVVVALEEWRKQL